ncbi:MAG: TerC family protein [Gammaproteobacteria bacterium]|nr:TerC family protein [Gammaproteobacteria bacterium]
MELAFNWAELLALGQVVMIDLVLAGDNAIVVAMAAAGLPAQQRNRVIFIGILCATVIRIVFALLTSQLLNVFGLLLAGGVLLLWVCWKFWRELELQRREKLLAARREHQAITAEENASLSRPAEAVPGIQTKTMSQAVIQIILADVSMSLDNVLAVAGAAQDHTRVLIIGLTLSVALMGAAATFIARLLQRHGWLAYVGLAIITWVAVSMIFKGGAEILAAAG